MEVQVLSPAPQIIQCMFKNKFFRSLPVETWLIGIPSLILFLITLNYSHNQNFSNSFFQNVLVYLSGNRFLFKGLILMYFYIFFRLFYVLFVKVKNKETTKSITREFVIVFRSLLFWLLLITAGTYTFANALSVLFRTSSLANIAHASHTILSFDLDVFKTYPSNALNIFFTSHAVLGALCLWAYSSLAYVVPITLIILICADPKKFRRFLISFFITGYIGLIVWCLIPATSPRGYIDINITHADTAFTTQYKATMASVTTPYITEMDNVWIDPNGVQSNVSTFPSMHASWGFLAMISLISLLPELALLLVPWLVALMIGAVTIYQHYAVDMIFGLILGGIIFALVGKIMDTEEAYFKDTYDLMYVWNIFRDDTKKAIDRVTDYC